MSLPHSDPDMYGVPTHVYLLPMGSALNLTEDSQVIPLHVLNNQSNNSHDFFLPLQSKEDKKQDQFKVLLDSCPDPSVKYVVPKQLYSTPIQSQKLPVPQRTAVKEISVETCVTDFNVPTINIPNETENTDASKKQLIKNYVHVPDCIVLPRAMAVLPTILQMRKRNVIFSRRTLPKSTRFGPIQGIKQTVTELDVGMLVLNAAANEMPIFLLRQGENIIHIDTSDKDKSNWIGLLPLGDETTANVWIYEENEELYIITTEALPPRKRLMLGYSKQYAQDYRLSRPIKGIETEAPVVKKKWWCYECHRALQSATQLHRHMRTHRQEPKELAKRRYRCRHCTRTFSRIFTLRRHVARYCSNKTQKSDNSSNEILPEANLNTSLNSEDNRLPSDESFQNYSNGLDFSTNLFDTDRMPSLDISGNSRSEVFNPYELVSESPLPTDMDSLTECTNKTNILPKEESKVVQKKTEPTTCPYCNEEVPAGKKRRHVRACPARRFECECKKVFPNKEQLAQHVFTQHSNEGEADKEAVRSEGTDLPSAKTVESDTLYKCDRCEYVFKRRGMLVNHLWRVHGTAARVPLRRRVLHYPCAACPKLYRTAAKRDRHARLHHPDMDKSRMPRPARLDGGSRECAPAACPVCPRQYATRAKLLQHQRQHHPHLNNPPEPEEILSNKTTTIPYQFLTVLCAADSH
ncbi:uncharacterized protein LOC142975584 [Anticarsia gemmatalis]|uniref:uncharacterized protein LOC142975584 n=1 Tax=Anticarsia gemmatalis TaxID=129554 RepID=UPI003F775A50